MATGILEMVYVQYERTWPCWGTGAGAASECQELLSFFLSLSILSNCLSLGHSTSQ